MGETVEIVALHVPGAVSVLNGRWRHSSNKFVRVAIPPSLFSSSKNDVPRLLKFFFKPLLSFSSRPMSLAVLHSMRSKQESNTIIR
jgi:hypothetical protein